MPDIAKLQKLQGMIQRTKDGIQKVQDQAIETGDFTELRRAQGVVKQLTSLAQRFIAEQQEAPPAPSIQPPTPEPAPPLPIGRQQYTRPGVADLVEPTPPAPAPQPAPAPTGSFDVPGTPRMGIEDLLRKEVPAPGTYTPEIQKELPKPDGSLRDFIRIEIPNALDELGKLGGVLSGEGAPASRPSVPAGEGGKDLGPLETPPGGIRSLLPYKEPQFKPPPEVMTTGQDKIDLASLMNPASKSLADQGLPPDFMVGPGYNQDGIDKTKAAVAPAVAKAVELGDSPANLVAAVQQEAQSTPGAEKDAEWLAEFHRRVGALGLDRTVPTWERVLTALAYGASNIFSRWVSRNWRMPLNFPDVFAGDRRNDDMRRQVALQLFSERSADRRQQTSIGAAATRQTEALNARQKVAEIQATAKAGRANSNDVIRKYNALVNSFGATNRVKKMEYDSRINGVKAQIEKEDEKLKSYMVPGPMGLMMPNEPRLKAEGFVDDKGNADMGPLYQAHANAVAPLYDQLTKTAQEAEQFFKATPGRVQADLKSLVPNK